MHLGDGRDVLQSKTMQISRRIFQGDFFSLFWVCLVLNPSSKTLNRNDHGYEIRYGDGNHEEVTYTFYMDDFKSRDIGLKFGPDECRSVQLLKVQLTDTDGYEIYDDE